MPLTEPVKHTLGMEDVPDVPLHLDVVLFFDYFLVTESLDELIAKVITLEADGAAEVGASLDATTLDFALVLFG